MITPHTFFLLRRGRWSAVIAVMIFDSTGNGNVSEMGEIIDRKIKTPGRFINYDVDRRMASFRPQGGKTSELVFLKFVVLN